MKNMECVRRGQEATSLYNRPPLNIKRKTNNNKSEANII